MVKEKLRRVKERLLDKLSKGALEEGEYWQTTYQLLREEEIVQGPYHKADTTEVTVRVATALLLKFHAKEYWGLEKRYVALKGVKLSPQAQEDLKKFSELERMTREYLKAELGKNPVFESEYEKMVESYLMNQTNLPNITTPEKQRGAVIRISVLLCLEGKFNIKEDPKKLGRYDIRSLEKALDEL